MPSTTPAETTSLSSTPQPGRAGRRWALLSGLAFLVAILLLGTFSGAAGASPSAASAPLPELGAMVAVQGSLPSLEAAHLGAPLPADRPVAGGLSFGGTDPAGQQAVAAAVNTPGSSAYHHFLTGNEFDDAFAPQPSEQASLRDYLASFGIEVVPASPFVWTVEGDAGAMGAAFGTEFVSATGATGDHGYALTTAPSLPSRFEGFVQLDGGFQNVVAPATLDDLRWTAPSTSARAGDHLRSAGTLTLNVSNAFVFYSGTGTFGFPPTNMNETYDLTIQGGAPPYTVSWHWGDGSVQTVTVDGSSLSMFHSYYNPGQTDWCYYTACGNITVWATDGSGDNGTYLVSLYPGASPTTVHSFYNSVGLYARGLSGQGTTIGLDEECDPTYFSYLDDANNFSAGMGLPLFTTSTLDLMGTGSTEATCTSGSEGWSGETMLDIEWSHTAAPNATLDVDLSNGALDEGDATWNTLSNGVFIASNSWGGGYTKTVWSDAAAQGQSYLTASGDCGSAGLASSAPANNPYGVGVGGTDIYPGPSGIFQGEFTWNGSTDPSGCENDEGSTGGYSKAFATPWYQTNMPGFAPPGDDIGVPDVAAIGGTWVIVNQDGWTVSAGTSLACPSWAGMLDMMYQYNGTATQANGLADNDLYLIAESANYDIGFHDIIVGNNLVNGKGYTANVGWDPITGLGSPNVAQLAMLIAAQNGNPSAIGSLVAVLSANVTFGNASLLVDFGADASGGPSNLSGYSYAWNFGDGTSVDTGPHPVVNHVYTVPGIYDATVTVSSGTFTDVSNTLVVHVIGPAPVISPLSVSADSNVTHGEARLAVAFNSSVSGGLAPYAYSWRFGDGGVSSQPDPDHAYTAPGSYDPMLWVNDSHGDHASFSLNTILVSSLNPPISAGASASPLSVAVGATVSFNATAAGGTSDYTFLWHFGDGGSASVRNPTHAYTSAGTYVAWLWVNDTASDSASAQTGAITVAATPLTATAGGLLTAVENSPASFWAAASGGTPPYSFVWSFGDGSAPQSTGTTNATDHTYGRAGTYTVTIWVNDSAGGSVERTLSVQVGSSSPGSGTSGGSGGGLSSTDLLLLAVLAAVVAAILIVVVLRRRKSDAAPPPPAGYGAPPPEYGGYGQGYSPQGGEPSMEYAEGPGEVMAGPPPPG